MISLLSTLSFIGCRDESDAIYLIDRAESLLKSDPDSSHILLDSIAVPDNLSDKLLARWCMLSGKVADTLYTDLPYVQQLLRAQAYYKSHGTKQEQAKIGLYLGRSYVEDKENEKAMKVYLQALDIALRSEDYNQAGYICSYMGDLYDFEGNYLLGKDKYKEAESYFRKAGNMRSSAFALRDVGRMYAFSDSLDIALIFLLKADTIIVEVGDSSDIGTIYNGIGNIYNMLGNKELAKLYLWKNVNMSDFDDAPSYRTLAGIYIEEGDFKNARICLEKASVPSFNDMTRFSVLYGYSLLEKAEGNWEKAWFYLDEYNSASDSILTIRNRENIIKIEKEYEHLKISLENMRLKSDKQKYFIYWVISVSILLILLWVFQIRIDRKNKRLLKQEIDLSNKSNELFRLRDNLRNKQDRLEALSIQLSEKNEKLNELDSREKLEKEYEQIKKEEEMILLAFNKPVGIVCTAAKDEKDNIVDYIHYPKRIYPVGRLDKDSQGLILLTNNGDIVNKMMRAGNMHEKEYEVTVNHDITETFLKKMSGGVPLEELGVVTRPCAVEKLDVRKFRIILTQGYNRQIRRMCEYCGYKVVKLKRVRIMNIELGSLKKGKYRRVTAEEWTELNRRILNSSNTTVMPK